MMVTNGVAAVHQGRHPGLRQLQQLALRQRRVQAPHYNHARPDEGEDDVAVHP